VAQVHLPKHGQGLSDQTYASVFVGLRFSPPLLNSKNTGNKKPGSKGTAFKTGFSQVGVTPQGNLIQLQRLSTKSKARNAKRE